MPEDDADAKTCYICWEDATDNQKPTHRDCSCKGTMGWVHMDCVIASTQSRADSPLRPWNKCPHCLEPYKDPTKSALEEAMWGGADQKWKRVRSIVQNLTKQLCIYVAFFLCRSLIIEVMSHQIVETVLPVLTTTWERALVDYHDGHFWSASMLQLVLLTVAAVALVIRYWNDVKRVLLYCFLLSAAVVTMVVAAEVTGLDMLVFVVAGGIVALSYEAYKHRAEMRQQGYWATLVNWMLVALAIFLAHLMEEHIMKLWRSWNRSSSNEWTELLAAIERYEEWILEKYESKQRFKEYMKSMREDYWWCCS